MEIVSAIFDQLLAPVSFTMNYNSNNDAGEAEKLSDRVLRRFLPFAEECMKVIGNEFLNGSSRGSGDAKVKKFGEIVRVLGAAMVTKFADRKRFESLWKRAVFVFGQVVCVGLPLVNRLFAAGTGALAQKDFELLWMQLYAAFRQFLFCDREFYLKQVTPSEYMADEKVIVELLDVFASHVLAQAKYIQTLHKRLICILEVGKYFYQEIQVFERSDGEDGDVCGSVVAERCYELLFGLCSKAGELDSEFSCHTQLAQAAVPLVLERAKEILEKFLEQESCAAKGEAKLPAFRLSEVYIILEHLLRLRLRKEALQGGDLAAHTASLAVSGERAHLLMLYPLLCECITTREPKIRSILRSIFLLIGSELAITNIYG
eukprot:TRINITY_DN7001_c0_g2_i1.p1 TRINITY_DN7001_c0_g2~~TRINITY_DN7001_c0_g2_i1.p1  ORF type:complete len:374 (+),score=70.81 TRINITY_DN7001_c0_g2_i1:650-1771(+)